jgi:hypothetical protein
MEFYKCLSCDKFFNRKEAIDMAIEEMINGNDRELNLICPNCKSNEIETHKIEKVS